MTYLNRANSKSAARVRPARSANQAVYSKAAFFVSTEKAGTGVV
jgi:hypothetical protein